MPPKRKRDGLATETEDTKIASKEENLPRVVILDFIQEASFEESVLKDVARVEWLNLKEGDPLPPEACSADAILMWHLGGLGSADLKRLQCKTIIRVGMGFDNVDIESAGQLGIPICNVPDYGTEEVADSALSLLLAIARKTYHTAKLVEDSQGRSFPTMEAKGSFRLRGSRLGIVGCGRIGTAVVLRAKSFGMEVTFYDPYVPSGYDKALGIQRVYSLQTLFETSDVISLHCLLSKETRHIVNQTSLSWCRRGTVLINTARGGLVEEKALLDALQSGHLKAAGIDVLEKEPYDDGHLHQSKVPNLILTPHCAWYSDQSQVELRTKAAEEARRAVLGQPLINVVNLKYLKSESVRCKVMGLA